jgi:hypothetical protein
MATHLEIVNKILRRLREDSVSSVAETEYSQLIGEFVEDIHREVSEYWTWPSTLTTVDFETTSGSPAYRLDAYVADGGAAHTNGGVVTERSILRVRDDGLPDIHIGDSSTDNNKKQVILLSDEQRHALANTASGTSGTGYAEYPTHASVRRDGFNRWAIQLWPAPSVTGKYVRTAWHIPEADLEVDGTTDDTEIYIPNRPIYLGALYLALNERGEEIGEPGGIAESRYIKALAAEKERAIGHEQTTGRFDWYRG